jgi:hypothetical protein
MRKAITTVFSIVFASAALWSSPNAEARVDADAVDFSGSANVTVITSGIVDNTFAALETRYNAPLVGSDNWRGFYRQGGRDINITLPEDKPIQRISIEMMQNGNVGILYPQYVEFQVNIGNQWYELGKVNTAIPVTDKGVTTQVFSIDCNNIKAHLFRIHFPVNIWVFARHVHVIGNPVAPPGAQPLPPLSNPPTPFHRPMSPTDARARGIRNMLLVYTGSHGDQGKWRVGDFLPMVAYQTRTGKVAGRMFDTMLFLPYGDIPDTRVGWQAYLNDLFAKNQQLSALDAAVGQANDMLKPFEKKAGDFKENVVIAIPYPNFGDQVWGRLRNQTIQFGGSKGDPDALSSRSLALQWYVDTLKNAWKDARFKHLQLTGLYWQNEQVDYRSQGEIDLIRNSARFAHACNLPLFWIPYFGATGLSDWKELGFDAAWIQPNFVFQGQSADLTRLTNAETVASEYGMGIEIEAPWQVISDMVTHNLYLQMLKQFKKDGIGENVSLAYYAGSKVMLDAATTENPDIRSVYDETYKLSHSEAAAAEGASSTHP